MVYFAGYIIIGLCVYLLGNDTKSVRFYPIQTCALVMVWPGILLTSTVIVVHRVYSKLFGGRGGTKPN